MKCGDRGYKTVHGEPCQQNVPKGAMACLWHSRSPEGRRALAMKGSIKAHLARFLPASALPPDFQSTASIVAWAQETAKKVLSGQLDPKAAGEARQLASLAISARVADATEVMATTLSSIEHGASAVLLLNRLQDSLRSGVRRPLPGRLTVATPPPPEPSA
jgi:hypothetical protein